MFLGSKKTHENMQTSTQKSPWSRSGFTPGAFLLRRTTALSSNLPCRHKRTNQYESPAAFDMLIVLHLSESDPRPLTSLWVITSWYNMREPLLCRGRSRSLWQHADGKLLSCVCCAVDFGRMGKEERRVHPTQQIQWRRSYKLYSGFYRG